MERANTVAKGDELEIRVFNLIRHLVKTNRFFVNGKYSEVYRQKDYYSRDREEMIRVDIAIESFLPGATEYSSLIIIECKNYKSKVPVSKVEDFCEKLNQIGQHNTKGIMISTSEFQKGALTLAKNRGLGLARLKDGNDLEWIYRRKASTLPRWTHEAVASELEENSTQSDFFGCIGEQCFSNLPSLLIAAGAFDFYQPDSSLIALPYLADEEIERRIDEWPVHFFFSDGKLNSDSLCELLSDVYQMDFDLKADLGKIGNQQIMGKLELDPLKISIHKDLASDIHRWRYTLAHEVGHLALHLPILERYYDQKFDTEENLRWHGQLSNVSNQRLELQANRFAAFLLLPTHMIMPVVRRYFKENNIYKGHLLLDHQGVNQQLVFGLIGLLRKRFEVSKEVIKLRLKQLGLLHDATDHSIGTLVRGLKAPFQHAGFERNEF